MNSPNNALPVGPGDVLAEKYRVERVRGTGVLERDGRLHVEDAVGYVLQACELHVPGANPERP